jgi:RNA polymerase sigma-70 factor (ECF subfamily)
MPTSAAMEESAHAAGRARWPDVPLLIERFREHLRHLSVAEQHLDARGAELYLAVAALDGNPQAIKYLDHDYVLPASEAVRRVDGSPDFLAEVRQQMRVKLLIGERPRLASYNGAGGLREWLQVIALRVALNMKRSDRRLVLDDRLELGLLLEGGGIEREAVKGRYLEDLRRGLEASFHSLGARERTLLRLHFVDALSIDAIGEMYGVHRATVARWLVAIRRSLFEAARAALAGVHHLDSRSLRSIYRMVKDDLHITVTRVLKGQAAGPCGPEARG